MGEAHCDGQTTIANLSVISFGIPAKYFEQSNGCANTSSSENESVQSVSTFGGSPRLSQSHSRNESVDVVKVCDNATFKLPENGSNGCAQSAMATDDNDETMKVISP